MTDDERNKKADEILANGKAISIELGISFSGTDCAGSPWGDDWLGFTDTEYYHRVRNILIEAGIPEGSTEMIIANCWEDGWTRCRETYEVD
jgi:hypothetical protein